MAILSSDEEFSWRRVTYDNQRHDIKCLGMYMARSSKLQISTVFGGTVNQKCHQALLDRLF